MLERVQADRQAKLDKIRQLGIDPYGGRYDTAEPIGNILKRYQDNQPGQKADAAGRLVLYRDMGKMIFAHLSDQTGKMQIALRKNALDEQGWNLSKLLDLGDIIAASGPVERTRTGEITIWADRLTMLSKSLNPMPEKFHGLSDVEIRYRQRYLDLMTNADSLNVFKSRVAIFDTFRRLLNARGFLEVETPVLQPIYGGAAARPFTTHHNTLDCELFLRISPELYLKRLMVGGMERVYEFSRNFRNEGIDTRHNPEFTLLELYQAYGDYEVMMEITEELITTSARQETVPGVLRQAERLRADADALRKAGDEPAAAQIEQSPENQAIFAAEKGLQAGKLTIPYGTRVLDITSPWRRAKYDDLMLEQAGASMKDSVGIREKARKLRIEESNKDDAVVVNQVFEAVVEPALETQDFPTFVIDYPAAICPLTRRKADDPETALRFEVFLAGMELGNAYTELNDPTVQEDNFNQAVRGEADGETMRVMDEDFVTALRHGMPPAGGLGIGMDRIIMLLTNRQSIRDVILFPLLRPQ